MNEKAVKIIPSLKQNLPAGKNYRLLCLTGQTKGKAYLINKGRVTLGRSNDADIIILDGKSSKLHGELKRVDGDFVLTDLGSRNGIYVNDLRIKQHHLQSGDKFVIGQTVYKYEVIEVEGKNLSALEEELPPEPVEKVKTGDEGKKKKRILIILFLGLAFLFMFDEEPKKKVDSEKRSIEEIINNRFKSKALKKAETIDPEIKKKLESIIHRGQREFREKNYFRAMSEFKHALNLDPGNSTSSYYLDKTKQALDSEIQSHFDSAKKAIDSIKYSNAVINYCSVIRLLQDYPEDKRYKAAEQNIKVVENKMGTKAGDIKCF